MLDWGDSFAAHWDRERGCWVRWRAEARSAAWDAVWRLTGKKYGRGSWSRLTPQQKGGIIAKVKQLILDPGACRRGGLRSLGRAGGRARDQQLRKAGILPWDVRHPLIHARRVHMLNAKHRRKERAEEQQRRELCLPPKPRSNYTYYDDPWLGHEW
jgi:hypothetical protein